MSSLPVYRSILVLDIERSTSALRTNPIRQELRDRLYGFLARAMAFAGIEERFLDPLEDRGDGVLALLRPVDQVPKSHLLSRLVPELVRLLADHDLELPPGERARRGLRLRAAVHAGEVHLDGNGCFGEAVDVACRMLDAPRLKGLLRAVEAPLVLGVSEDIYRGVVRHGYDGIDTDAYRFGYSVLVGERRHRVFVHVPSVMAVVEAAS
ncbi:hypothetical protein [Actinomadura kijaniata]|uniref:hypothetical protein n=1 Tax=Actinomadura kijaniata TaxID=46161 RepID=UPI00083410EF|nr:hypothetical protein [Actinomadura kijaniata]